MTKENEKLFRLVLGEEIGPDTVILHMPPERAMKLADKLLQLVDLRVAEISIPVFGRLEAITERPH